MVTGSPEPSGNLLLCGYASLSSEGSLLMADAGLKGPPSDGAPWYMAGVIDLPLDVYLQGGKLRVVDLDKQLVPGSPTGTLSPEIDGSDLDDTELSTILRAPIVLLLPSLENVETEGVFYWETSFGDWAHRVPFMLSHESD